jgi:hypothetical protein
MLFPLQRTGNRLGVFSCTLVLGYLPSILSADVAPATILNFDDLPVGYNLTTNGYAGLTWEQSNLSSEGTRSSWITSSNSTYGYPRSQPCDVINGGGLDANLIGIGFPLPVDVSGAYFVSQGTPPTVWASSIVVHGYRNGIETGTTGTLGPVTTNAQWLDMSALTGVDRIVFQVGWGTAGIGAFGMDDLTFTYIPEPAGLSLLGLGGSILRRRRSRLRESHNFSAASISVKEDAE